jgi:hypothetical protein
MSEEIKDALEYLKQELPTIQTLAVHARNMEQYENTFNGVRGRDQRTVTYFAMAALTTMVIDLERRLSTAETELANLKRLEADGK